MRTRTRSRAFPRGNILRYSYFSPFIFAIYAHQILCWISRYSLPLAVSCSSWSLRISNRFTSRCILDASCIIRVLISSLDIQESANNCSSSHKSVQVRWASGHWSHAVPSELHCRHPWGRRHWVCFLRAVGQSERAVPGGIRRVRWFFWGSKTGAGVNPLRT